MCSSDLVATRTGGLPYLVEDGETGWLVGVGDVAALADRVARVLLDDQARSAAATAARAAAARRFDPAVVAARARAVYRSALADAV